MIFFYLKLSENIFFDFHLYNPCTKRQLESIVFVTNAHILGQNGEKVLHAKKTMVYLCA